MSERATCRFAVLHHSGVEPDHYDLLFEASPGSALVTFRLEQFPILRDQFATKLRDHRRMYLDYEGPVPGDRGRVDRVAEGSLLVDLTPTRITLMHPDGRIWLTLEPEDANPLAERWWASLAR